jgi:hypothetical protein
LFILIAGILNILFLSVLWAEANWLHRIPLSTRFVPRYGPQPSSHGHQPQDGIIRVRVDRPMNPNQPSNKVPNYIVVDQMAPTLFREVLVLGLILFPILLLTPI